MKLLTVVALTFLLLVPAAAHADTFTLSSVLQQGTPTGIISIDTHTGAVTDSNLDFTLGNFHTSIFGDASIFHPISSYLSLTEIYDLNAAGEYLQLILPGTSLVGFTGGGVCSSFGTFCRYSPTAGIVSSLRVNLNGSPTAIAFLSGTLTPTAAVTTPEPGTFTLLVIGLLGAGAAIKRRRLS